MINREPVSMESAFRQAYKRDALLAQGGCCRYCYEPLNLGLATVEHIIPVSKGGTGTKENIGVSCWSCNNLKGKIPEDEFVNLLDNPPKAHKIRQLRWQLTSANRRIWRATHGACRSILQMVDLTYPTKIEEGTICRT